MARIVAATLLLALAGCAGTVPSQHAVASACTLDEASYACQVERYNAVSAP